MTHKPDRKVVLEKTRQTEPVETPDPVETVERGRNRVDERRHTRPRHGEVVQTNFVDQLAAFAPKRSNLALATPMLAQPTSHGRRVAQDRCAAGGQRDRHRRLRTDLVRRECVRGAAEGAAGQRSHRQAVDAEHRRRQEVPADWYFPDTYDPESETPPERIIYLQHGFLARGVFYDYTASYLAKETNSIVVAPTLTSNIFATDGMWLGGDPMHRAVADLFLDDNPALLNSAPSRGLQPGPLPQQVVLVGHSLGGGPGARTSRAYMAADERVRDPRRATSWPAC